MNKNNMWQAMGKVMVLLLLCESILVNAGTVSKRNESEGFASTRDGNGGWPDVQSLWSDIPITHNRAWFSASPGTVPAASAKRPSNDDEGHRFHKRNANFKQSGKPGKFVNKRQPEPVDFKFPESYANDEPGQRFGRQFEGFQSESNQDKPFGGSYSPLEGNKEPQGFSSFSQEGLGRKLVSDFASNFGGNFGGDFAKGFGREPESSEGFPQPGRGAASPDYDGYDEEGDYRYDGDGYEAGYNKPKREVEGKPPGLSSYDGYEGRYEYPSQQQGGFQRFQPSRDPQEGPEEPNFYEGSPYGQEEEQGYSFGDYGRDENAEYGGNPEAQQPSDFRTPFDIGSAGFDTRLPEGEHEYLAGPPAKPPKDSYDDEKHNYREPIGGLNRGRGESPHAPKDEKYAIYRPSSLLSKRSPRRPEYDAYGNLLNPGHSAASATESKKIVVTQKMANE